MGRHTKGRRKKDERGGPSIWFFVALAIGIALLVWAAITVARTPVQVPEKPKTTTELRLELQALSSKLLAPSCKLQAASSKLQAPSCKLLALSSHVTLSRADGEESQAPTRLPF